MQLSGANEYREPGEPRSGDAAAQWREQWRMLRLRDRDAYPDTLGPPEVFSDMLPAAPTANGADTRSTAARRGALVTALHRVGLIHGKGGAPNQPVRHRMSRPESGKSHRRSRNTTRNALAGPAV